MSDREKRLERALRRLSFAAQTTGGTAGRDDELVAAIEQAGEALADDDAGGSGPPCPKHSEPGREECGWSLDDEDYYQTDCGTEFETVDFLTLEEMPSMKYCANCGRRIRDDSPAPDADERE